MGFEHESPQVFEGRALECIRFPLGGVGAGCVSLTTRRFRPPYSAIRL